ncbi:MAG: hypothetical protein H6572_06145 [Lewinellaceae bacterium]|nr:hypothetical protein [Lewinellaceae bacterium]
MVTQPFQSESVHRCQAAMDSLMSGADGTPTYYEWCNNETGDYTYSPYLAGFSSPMPMGDT